MTTARPHHILVADDELPSRQFVCELVKQDARFQIVAVCDTGLSTIEAAQNLHLDAAFLDIQMPGKDGFEVMEAFAKDSPLVVFVTAFGDYALRAFEQEAFDYIKKPIDPARFSRVLQRIDDRLAEKQTVVAPPKQTLSEEPAAISAAPVPPGKKLLNAVRQDLIYQESELQLIESAGNYINVRINNEFYLVRDSLDRFCRNLDSTHFVRVHRSFVVNVHWVRQMRYGKSGSAELDLADGYVVPVSRGRRKEVTEILRRLIDSSDIQDDGYVI